MKGEEILAKSGLNGTKGQLLKEGKVLQKTYQGKMGIPNGKNYMDTAIPLPSTSQGECSVIIREAAKTRCRTGAFRRGVRKG